VAHHFGLEQVYLLTHDMGNSVALEILQRGTPVVERLILLNGSVLLDYYRPLLTQKLLLHPVIGPVITRWRLIKKPMFARQFGKLFAQKPPQTEIDDFWELIGHNQGMANYHLLIQYLNERLVHQHTWLSALKNHSAPLTVIWGQRDPVSVPKIAEAILTCRPDASYHPLAEVGHFPQWEAPETVAKIIATAFN
jgi:pimeloyl-ACP methyl ester carboxylesterase